MYGVDISGTRDILRDTGYALVDTVGTRAKKPQELNQGALGFLGFDNSPAKTQDGARQKARDSQRRIADLRVGFLRGFLVAEPPL